MRSPFQLVHRLERDADGAKGGVMSCSSLFSLVLVWCRSRVTALTVLLHTSFVSGRAAKCPPVTTSPEALSKLTSRAHYHGGAAFPGPSRAATAA